MIQKDDLVVEQLNLFIVKTLYQHQDISYFHNLVL